MRWTCYPIQSALGIALIASGFAAAGAVVLGPPNRREPDGDLR